MHVFVGMVSSAFTPHSGQVTVARMIVVFTLMIVVLTLRA